MRRGLAFLFIAAPVFLGRLVARVFYGLVWLVGSWLSGLACGLFVVLCYAAPVPPFHLRADQSVPIFLGWVLAIFAARFIEPNLRPSKPFLRPAYRVKEDGFGLAAALGRPVKGPVCRDFAGQVATLPDELQQLIQQGQHQAGAER